jgi:hypothetical protein
MINCFSDSAPYTAPWNATIALTSPLSMSLVWEPFPDSLWYDYPRGYHITFQRVALGGIRTSGDNITIVRVGYKTASYSWNNLQYYTRYKVEISTFTYRGYGPRVVLYGGKAQNKLFCWFLTRKNYQSRNASDWSIALIRLI